MSIPYTTVAHTFVSSDKMGAIVQTHIQGEFSRFYANDNNIQSQLDIHTAQIMAAGTGTAMHIAKTATSLSTWSYAPGMGIYDLTNDKFYVRNAANDANVEVVELNATQTLTNKTLDEARISNRVTTPTPAVGTGNLYTKYVSSQEELHFVGRGGTEVRLTYNGNINATDPLLTDTGSSSDTYVITPDPAKTSYRTDDTFFVKIRAAGANTGACTINVNSLGAKSIKLCDGTDPGVGQLRAAGLYLFKYDGTNMILLNPSDISGLVGSQTYSTAGTYTFTHGVTCPSWVTRVYVDVWGGGGGGGGGYGGGTTYGGGGGGGGWAGGWITIAYGASITCTVGAAGTAGSSGGGNGGAGGSSSYGTSATATGGGGATGSGVTGGTAGSGSGPSSASGTAGTSGGSGNAIGRAGGAAGGGGGAGGSGGTYGASVAGTAPGGGGQGGGQNGGTGYTAAAGAVGQVKIQW